MKRFVWTGFGTLSLLALSGQVAQAAPFTLTGAGFALHRENADQLKQQLRDAHAPPSMVKKVDQTLAAGRARADRAEADGGHPRVEQFDDLSDRVTRVEMFSPQYHHAQVTVESRPGVVFYRSGLLPAPVESSSIHMDRGSIHAARKLNGKVDVSRELQPMAGVNGADGKALPAGSWLVEKTGLGRALTYLIRGGASGRPERVDATEAARLKTDAEAVALASSTTTP